MLDFHRLMAETMLGEDGSGLLIAAQGIGMNRVISTFIQTYLDPQNLVILLGASTEDVLRLSNEITDTMQGLGLQYLTEINSETQRSPIYSKGGVVSLSTVMVLTDLLNEAVPVHLITGFIVLHAEKLTSSEAFVLRLFKDRNKDGWVRAFSDDVENMDGLKLEKTCRQLQIRRVFLWPRFQLDIAHTLDSVGQPEEACEIRVDMTDSMTKIQNSLMSCIGICVKELIKGSKQLDADEVTLESALFSSFDQRMQGILYPTWHLLSQRTKSMLGEITTLRKLLDYLVNYDCVSFFSFLETIVVTQRDSSWMLLDEADLIFAAAKARVYLKPLSMPMSYPTLPKGTLPVLESQPKWLALRRILQDIEEDRKGPILIMCRANVVVRQLVDYLASSSKKRTHDDQQDDFSNDFLMARLVKYFAWKSSLPSIVASEQAPAQSNPTKPQYSRRRVRGGGNQVSKNRLSNQVQDEAAELQIPESMVTEAVIDLQTISNYGVQECSELIFIRAYSDDDEEMLREIRPCHVVMYDPSMTMVRRLETFKATNPHHPLAVQFMVYAAGLEEQRYLSTIRKEKDVFERLIREKSSMVIPLGDVIPQVEPEFNPRIAGGGRLHENAPKQQVIVDTRELRSTLPSLIYAAGISLAVKTLEVGDYVLTPTMCVERKSTSDLISSFKSGRLYTQVEAMDAHYLHPILLIEFSQSRAFSFASVSEVKNDINIMDIQSKLVLLTKSFPKLKVLWSSSPQATAEMFEDLKVGQPQPDILQAASIGAENLENVEGNYTITPVDILRALPGINSKNFRKVMNKMENILELIDLDQDSLGELIGPEMARALYIFAKKNAKR
jgi:DNA excision repair protein ERCC-4